MKKIIILLLFTIFLTDTNAQKWALPSSTWVTTYSWLSPTIYTKLQVEKDTLIQGKLCKKIDRFNPIFTYEENDTVFFLLNGLFRPTYYFNVEVGDTISLYVNNYCLSLNFSHDTDSIFYATIDSIDSIDVGNKFLKRYHCEIYNFNVPGSTMESLYFNYTEFIGSNYIYPDFTCYVDQEFYGICDYGDSTIQDFYVFKNDCIGVSIQDLENQNEQISIYPNPVANFLNLQLDFNTESHILTIRNAIGQIVKKFTVTQGENKLDIRHFRSGIYFATLNDINTIKFIKE